MSLIMWYTIVPPSNWISDMNKSETRSKVHNEIMRELNARLMWEIKGPTDTEIASLCAYTVGCEIVIVQFYKDGGCQHYVQGHGNTWEAMETQLHQIAAEAA